MGPSKGILSKVAEAEQRFRLLFVSEKASIKGSGRIRILGCSVICGIRGPPQQSQCTM